MTNDQKSPFIEMSKKDKERYQREVAVEESKQQCLGTSGPTINPTNVPTNDPISSPTSGPTKKKKKKVVDPLAPKKPVNSFLKFINVKRLELKDKPSNIPYKDQFKLFGAEWAKMSP